ncbi:MAG: class I SAM-dependent methyltransferase [Litoreibacter sp.]|nr:class I SAM-dependent methyltransferase [Litoreibacter sp.]
MWTNLFHAMLTHFVRIGDLHVTLPDGTIRQYGDGTRPFAAIHIKDPSLLRRIVMNPDLGVGEGYMEGTLTIDDEDLYGFLELAVRNAARPSAFVWWQQPLRLMRRALRVVEQYNPIERAPANVAHHYDLSGELYDLFLDADLQYSCAYFRKPSETLEQAQDNKKRHIASKLLIEPGMRVLDIGCGWGGLALTLASEYGAHVLGVTLSKEQHEVACQRARAAGLQDQVEFRLMDYRAVEGEFDRIVSVGMFEHVGVPHYREFFDQVHHLLKPDGVALIHTIGRSSPPGTTSSFIAKYIFPGGYVPALSETMRAIEHQDLCTTDIEVWRLHYAETLKHWRARFEANIDKVRDIYDERFCRMWRYYLIAAELTFRHDHQVVFQFQLTHRQDAVPLTRDYLYQPEKPRRLRQAAE